MTSRRGCRLHRKCRRGKRHVATCACLCEVTQSSITEIRFTSPGGKVNVYLLCKPQKASPAGPVAMGLWGNFAPAPPKPPRPFKLPVCTCLAPPVNFLSRVHRYADISGINLLLRIVMPMQMYTRWLSAGLGVGSHRKYSCVSLRTARAGAGTDIWDERGGRAASLGDEQRSLSSL